MLVIDIHIENFDGPMDLLLSLVKETKLDLYEVNISMVIESYLNYINTLKELNIDVGGDFLLMASTLVHLKSKKLIGKANEDESESTSEFDITSEEDLKNKLIEYEKYKKASHDLELLALKRSEIYEKVPSSLKEYMKSEELVNNGVTPIDLQKALLDVIKRLNYKKPLETKISRKEVSVGDRINFIRNKLSNITKCYFEDLFLNESKDYIVATFLAVLEMSKDKEIRLKQENNFSKIEVEKV